MSTRNLPKHLQDLYRHGERCRKNLMALLEKWPVAEHCWRVGFKIRVEPDRRLIRKMLFEAEQWVRIVSAQRALHDRLMLKDSLERLRFAVLQDDFKDNAIADVERIMNQTLSLVESIPFSQSLLPKNQDRLVKVQKGTAFILMSIGELPELVDTCNTIKRVCGDFGFRAFRADDIQHQGKIMDQIMKHITTSEVLIADLTGETPNVYFEIGCAHMAEREPILLRKYGTRLHFDLSGYNVPEYKSFFELESLLGNKLKALRQCRN